MAEYDSKVFAVLDTPNFRISPPLLYQMKIQVFIEVRANFEVNPCSRSGEKHRELF